MLGRQEGDSGFNQFLGCREDLRQNVRGIADVAELDDSEKKWLFAQVDAIDQGDAS